MFTSTTRAWALHSEIVALIIAASKEFEIAVGWWLRLPFTGLSSGSGSNSIMIQNSDQCWLWSRAHRKLGIIWAGRHCLKGYRAIIDYVGIFFMQACVSLHIFDDFAQCRLCPWDANLLIIVWKDNKIEKKWRFSLPYLIAFAILGTRNWPRILAQLLPG